MLRASVDVTGEPADLRGVVDPMVDPLVRAGVELRALTDAAVLRDPFERDVALAALVDAVGADAARRAAAVAGNFDMMNRVLDAIGVAPTARSLAIVDELGMEWPSRV